MKRFRPKAWQSILILVGLAPLFLDGCVSIGVSRSKAAAAGGATGSLEVLVVEKSSDAKPIASRVVTHLVRLESGFEQAIFESADSTWTKSDLPPGRYLLRVSEWIDHTGKLHRLSQSDQKGFNIRGGERVQARVVLKKFPTGAVVTIAVVVGIGIAAAVIISSVSHSLGSLGKSWHDTKTESYQKENKRLHNPMRSRR